MILIRLFSAFRGTEKRLVPIRCVSIVSGVGEYIIDFIPYYYYDYCTPENVDLAAL